MNHPNGISASAQSEASSRPTFLETVARAYISVADSNDFSKLCFVFPNRRAGTFFLKAFSKELGNRVALAPEVMAAPEFMERISGRIVTSRIDLLFRLYSVYKKLISSRPELSTDRGLLDFDRFAPWGETVINDFNEVDRYDAPADELFKNVRDFRNLSTNFLSDEQLEIIQRYFGFMPQKSEVEGFWKEVDRNFESSTVKERFVELWRLLPELYEGLRESLETDGLTMTGTSYRQAMERVIELADNPESFDLPWTHVVMVGFNMLSTTEARIFESLASLCADDGRRYAEFFWDATGPVLGSEGASHNTAARAVRRNIKNFPMPEWARPFVALSDVSDLPGRLTIVAAPSNVAQAKIASQYLGHLKEFDNAEVAVVLPDEDLLLPLVHCMPANVQSVNLTMGYPMRHTSIASFIYHLRRLHMHRRRVGNEYGFYHEDLRLFISHPLVHRLIGASNANVLVNRIANDHVRIVTPRWLKETDAAGGSKLAAILESLPRGADVRQTVDYISGVLFDIDEALQGKDADNPALDATMERIQISIYQQALTQLLTCIVNHDIEMGFQSVFHLVDRLIAGESVTFEGKPLEGLQIMGLLETRALDFKKLIVLSMNDRVMPSRSRTRTFIPDTLRRGFGMPPSSQGEEMYAYYFYRMISRASEVTLIYDARAGDGMRSGGKSRFLMQLQLLYGRDRIRFESDSFDLVVNEPQTYSVEKTPTVLKLLGEYLTDNNELRRNLSASALMNYVECPVKFYYKNVFGLRDEDISENHIDAITMGQIVHQTMLNLYFPEGMRNVYLESPILLKTDDIDSILDNDALIERTVRRAVNKEHFHIEKIDPDRPLTGSVAIQAHQIERLIRNVLECDRNLASSETVELIAGEFGENVKWNTRHMAELCGLDPSQEPDLDVNVRFAIDRIDRVNGQIRIVDYKSGGAGVQADDLEDLFSGSKNSKYFLQLMIYACLLEDKVRRGNPTAPTEDIGIVLYQAREKADKVRVVPAMRDYDARKKDGSVPKTFPLVGIENHRHRFLKDFVTRFNRMLSNIFDPEMPFEPADDADKCKFCKFQYLCGRDM